MIQDILCMPNNANEEWRYFRSCLSIGPDFDRIQPSWERFKLEWQLDNEEIHTAFAEMEKLSSGMLREWRDMYDLREYYYDDLVDVMLMDAKESQR